METPDFVNGKYNTHFIANNEDFLFKSCFEGRENKRTSSKGRKELEDIVMVSALLEYNYERKMANGKADQNGIPSSKKSSWKEFGRKKSATSRL